MKEKISIIVPVYNAEKYLDKCIESIINQTYSNLEIILIDDGSSDGSPKKCVDWSKKDKRIKVVHKENGGVASARNIGVQTATGKFIGFVDSDDTLEKDYYERMYNNLKKYNADISMCSYNDEYKNGKAVQGKTFEDGITTIERMEAIKNLVLENNISNHLWNKLYKKNLFDGIVFPNGRKMEDLSVMYLLFEKTNLIVFEKYNGYHYLQHGDSIMGNINRSLTLDYEKAVFERGKYLINKYPELNDEINIDYLKTYKLLHYLAVLSGERDLLKSNRYKEYYKKYKKEYLNYRKQIKENVGKKGILSFDLFWFSKKIYSIFINIKKHKNK